jgi:hypothetical protein
MYPSAVLLAAVAIAVATPVHATSPAVLPDRHRDLLQEHCVACHGPEKQEGRFRVDTLTFSITSIEAAERWQKVLNAMNAGEMPPEDAKQPPKESKADLLDDLAQTMVVARRSLSDQHGVITMRRLNHREYANTIRDLLGVDADVRSLPADDSAGAFDTVGTSLFMSSDQFQTYRVIGKQALETAFTVATTPFPPQKHRVEPEVNENKVLQDQLERQVSIQKRFRLWKHAVDAAAALPENAAIVADIRTRRKGDPRGVYLEWEKLSGNPSPVPFGFPDADDAFHHDEQWNMFVPTNLDYLTRPASQHGMFLGVNSRFVAEVPAGWPAGDYQVRVRIARAGPQALVPSRTDFQPFVMEAPDESRCFLDVLAWGGPPNVLGSFQVTAGMESPQEIIWSMTVDTSGARHFQLRERGDEEQRPAILAQRARGGAGFGLDPAIWIDWCEIEGPMPSPTAARRQAEIKAQLERFDTGEVTAQQFIGDFASRALRGHAPTDAFIDRLAARYEKQRREGLAPRQALVESLSILLASPSFLYLAEPGVDATTRPISDLELASRLSYFLWSGPPDAELLASATQGTLHRPDVLCQQVDRLLDDARANAFVHAFVGQWLRMSRLDFFQFDLKRHPNFNAGVKEAARDEVYQTFAHLLRSGGSLSRLLLSDTVVINALLADYYGIPGVAGDSFRPVTLPTDSPRGGLLGMAAILAMGSNGEDTSPVERGAWVLRKLLHAPPPPAPPNVPQLVRLEGRLLTTRERLQAHQEDPQCASCHRRIDPIGFGLENFDAVGRWRTEDSYEKQGVGTKTWTIESAGAFHNGPAFKDFHELRAIIAAKPADFATGFTEALIEYGLGRSCGFSDDELVASIVSRAASKDFAVREFIHALVDSEAFQTK